MTWHIDQDVLNRYQGNVVDRVTAASVERHLTLCSRCRTLVTLDDPWLERSWLGIAERVEPGSNRLERTLRRLGLPEALARLVALSPAMRVSFLLALLLVIGFAAVASTSNPTGGTYEFFLVIAPLVPVLGVAFAYGRMADPAHEMTLISPTDTFRLLMIRAVTVVTVAIIGCLIAWPFVPAPSSLGAWAWLLPALALTLVTLALASRFEMWLASAMVGGGWLLAMSLALTRDFDVFGSTAQTVHLMLGVLAGVLMVIRRTQYDRQGGGR